MKDFFRAGWGSISSNWGNIASVVGAVLTVVFSWAAANASRRSQIASEQTRQKLQSVDQLTELNRLLGRVDDLLFRLEHQAWVIVNERATDLRVSIAGMMTHGAFEFSEENAKRLGEAVIQFKNIASGSDRVTHAGGKPPDVARYRRIASDQKETLVLAAQELKVFVGETE